MQYLPKSAAALFVCALLLPAAPAGEPRIVKEILLYTYSEDITYIPTGPYARHVAFLEDMKVIGLPVPRMGNDSTRTLFDFSTVVPNFPPNGLAYITTEQRFVIVTRNYPDKLFVFDSNGRLTTTRTIELPSGYTPTAVEGIGYIPPDAAVYPDHLALCAAGEEGAAAVPTSNVFILRRDGSLARRITLPPGSPECVAVAFQPPARFLITGPNDSYGIVTPIDLDGNILTPHSPQLPSGYIEGVTTLPSGEVLAIGEHGIIYSLTGDLQRVPERDRLYRPDAGPVSKYVGVAWDTGRQKFVLNGAPFNLDFIIYSLFNMSPALTELTRIGDFYVYPGSTLIHAPGKMTFLPAENLVAMRHSRRNNPPHPRFVPASILLLRNSDASLAEMIDLTPLDLGNPIAIAHLPERAQFAASFQKPLTPGEPGIVRLLSRTGDLVRTIDYSPAITTMVRAIAAFNSSHPSGGQLLLAGDSGATLHLGDLDGAVTARFPATVLPGMRYVDDLATIDSGEYSGSFAALASSRWGSVVKVVIFRLDSR